MSVRAWVSLGVALAFAAVVTLWLVDRHLLQSDADARLTAEVAAARAAGQRALDSSANVRRGDSIAQAEVKRLADSTARSAVKAQAFLTEANRLLRVQDSLLLEQHDTLTVLHWRLLYTAAHSEALDLRAALTSAQAELASVTESNVVLSTDRLRLLGQVTRADTAVAKLNRALADQSKAQRCRVVFVPCPSRTVVGVFSVVVGGIGGAVLARR